MTWSGKLRISDVSLINGDTEITAVAHSDETVEVQQVSAKDPETNEWVYQSVSVPRINSNTEGEIASVYVVMTIKGQKPEGEGLKIGDEINVTGHFTN